MIAHVGFCCRMSYQTMADHLNLWWSDSDCPGNGQNHGSRTIAIRSTVQVRILSQCHRRNCPINLSENRGKQTLPAERNTYGKYGARNFGGRLETRSLEPGVQKSGHFCKRDGKPAMTSKKTHEQQSLKKGVKGRAQTAQVAKKKSWDNHD